MMTPPCTHTQKIGKKSQNPRSNFHQPSSNLIKKTENRKKKRVVIFRTNPRSGSNRRRAYRSASHFPQRCKVEAPFLCSHTPEKCTKSACPRNRKPRAPRTVAESGARYHEIHRRDRRGSPARRNCGTRKTWVAFFEIQGLNSPFLRLFKISWLENLREKKQEKGKKGLWMRGLTVTKLNFESYISNFSLINCSPRLLPLFPRFSFYTFICSKNFE